MTRKPTAAQIIMDGPILCGGEMKSRRQIYDELLAEGHDRGLVDWYLFCLSERESQEQQQEEA